MQEEIALLKEGPGEWICPKKGCKEMYSNSDIEHAILISGVSLIKVGVRSSRGKSHILVRPACAIDGIPMVFEDEVS